MRLNSIIFAAIFAVAAHAQDAQDGLSPEAKECISKCATGDVVCLAHCPGRVPSPNEDNIAQLNDCSTACDQGDGSEAATTAYGKCLENCVVQYYYDPSVGTPNQGFGGSGGSGNSTSSGSGSSSSGSGSDNSSSSGNSTSSDSKDGDKKGNAATLIGSSLLGVVAAMLAL